LAEAAVEVETVAVTPPVLAVVADRFIPMRSPSVRDRHIPWKLVVVPAPVVLSTPEVALVEPAEPQVF
jgi:hypothetical protein